MVLFCLRASRPHWITLQGNQVGIHLPHGIWGLHMMTNGPVPEDQGKHGGSSETHPRDMGSRYLIARFHLGSTLKVHSVVTRVIRATQLFGGAEPWPLIFPVFKLIEIAATHTNIHISTHTSHTWRCSWVIQRILECYTGSQTISGGLFKTFWTRTQTLTHKY